MRLLFHKKTAKKVISRLKNRVKIRKKVSGTLERPRLSVFRSGRHMYGQLIDDVAGKVLTSSSTLKVKVEGGKSSVDAAKAVGKDLAEKAASKNIKNIVFDRSGYVYHGRVKALAEGAREGGLNF
ncbi:MAG: 50S ribosomal protein L18 [Bdellovibrionales bacterium]|nr:50S ribosomal protein L18 [Bdellovibrionales bacterium]